MKTMYKGKAFSPITTISAEINSSATVIPVDDVTVFPDGPNLATIGTDENAETILYATKTSDSLSGCIRGLEGSPKIWGAGEAISRNFTALDYSTLVDNVSQLFSEQELTAKIDERGHLILTLGTGKEVDAGEAKGKNGITPNIKVGTTTTGAPGSKATVTRRSGSPDTAPIFDFIIPQGPKGDKGEPAPAGGGKKTVRFVVGTSTAGWTAADCDYLCDGTDDQVEINAAIQALPAGGGEVRILDGTYNITASIEVNKANTKLSGSRGSSILKALAQELTVAHITQDNCTIVNLSFDASDGTYRRIYLVKCEKCNNFVAKENLFAGNLNSNCLCGLWLEQSAYSIICANIGVTCGDFVSLIRSSFNSISNNVFYSSNHNNNERGVTTWDPCNNNSIMGNVFINPRSDSHLNYGIDFFGGPGQGNVISGNVCYNNGTGMVLTNNNFNNNVVVGNVCIRGNGSSGDYSPSDHTIKIGGKKNIVVGNSCLGKAIVDQGTGNMVVNNQF